MALFACPAGPSQSVSAELSKHPRSTAMISEAASPTLPPLAPLVDASPASYCIALEPQRVDRTNPPRRLLCG